MWCSVTELLVCWLMEKEDGGWKREEELLDESSPEEEPARREALSLDTC